MRLQALFTAGDLARAVNLVTPARVSLDKDDPKRFIWVSKPVGLRLVDGSIIVDARAQIHWDALGISVPITLKSVSLSLRPTVEEIDGHEALSFHIQIIEADLSGVPSFVERPLVERVNDALRASNAKMSWRFLDTLDFKFKVRALEPERQISLYARTGSTEVTDEGLHLTVHWGASAELVPGKEALVPPSAVASATPSRADEPVGGPRPRDA